MADINHIITLGIGTPANIERFILVGLNISDAVLPDILETRNVSQVTERRNAPQVTERRNVAVP